MKTTMETPQITKDEELNAFAQELLNHGFTIIAPKDASTYYHFAIDGNIGYVQSNQFEGYGLSTVHKPCRECGTGYEFMKSWDALTIKNALDCAKCFAPNWAKASEVKAIKKYKDVADFTNDWFRKDSVILTPIL